MSPQTPNSALLQTYGWDEQWHDSFTTTHTPNTIPARVLRAERGLCEVITAHGPDRITLLSNKNSHEAGNPTTGDWISMFPAANAAPALLDTVLPRRTVLARAGTDGSSRSHVLAANVDIVILAISLSAPLRHTRTERLLSLVWESGARPIIVLTKADAHPEPESVRAEVSALALGVEVFLTSAETLLGVSELRASLAGTIALLGPSGVGKSTLGNLLLGDDVLDTGRVRSGDGKGRHTTAWRELQPLPGGQVLLDTPGLRSVGLLGSDEGLGHTFADVEELSEECRFSDCGHTTEPGCAVLAAISNGDIAQRRLDSYRKLQREASWMASKSDARTRSKGTAEKKSISRHLRSVYKARDDFR